MTVPNVLATRYASPAMREIWSPENKIIAERRLWLAVLAAQRDLGVDFGGDDPDRVIADYDQRADAENLIGEAQREGVLAIPSKRFQAHHAFFQIVMLAYNLWRWMKLLAGHAQRQKPQGVRGHESQPITMPDHTIRIARLKMLFVAAKILFHGRRDEVRYSIHEQRAAGLMDFLAYLDRRRKEAA